MGNIAGTTAACIRFPSRDVPKLNVPRSVQWPLTIREHPQRHQNMIDCLLIAAQSPGCYSSPVKYRYQKPGRCLDRQGKREEKKKRKEKKRANPGLRNSQGQPID